MDSIDNFPPSEYPPKALLAKEVKVVKTKPSLASIYEQMREKQKRDEFENTTSSDKLDEDLTDDDPDIDESDASDVIDYDL